ncbi:tetratricopeptide repeat protein [Romeria aff. gracilis LEGE 07310]|uniref:Tetratricopeptide repeat protein n=1 Tax=Vasconcelosia minhoensis LEGE 07310 TaxID=915328 RepID=A0A8J7DQJ3_9CYAN|nr:tetratricopeptide repeat protein [Romeria gracilis]MBE9076654.1 tetratricopeptide repeat protein [Romeria aff. gracilis LEGE 07310]
MILKRDSWIVRGILILAIVAFVGGSLAFVFSGPRNRASGGPASTAQTATPEEQRAELEGRANGYALVLEREPNNQAALLGLVEARLALEDLPGVVEPLQKLAELNPAQPDYAVLLAQTKQQLGDLEGAAQVYRSVLTTNPGNMNALEGMVALLINQQRPQAAVGLLQDTLTTAEQANQIQPGSIDTTSVKLLLGQVYVEQERFQDAIAIYDEAIAAAAAQGEVQPDFRPTLAKALVLQRLGRMEEAQPLFDNALTMAPAEFKDSIEQLMSGNAADADATTIESAPLDAEAPVTPAAESEAESVPAE